MNGLKRMKRMKGMKGMKDKFLPSTRMRLRHWTVLWFLSAVLFLTGCSTETRTGDVRETTASIGTLPSFLRNASDEVRATYHLAAKHADMLEWMPCTCGCGSLGHRNNRDCFIDEMRLDGAVVWNAHAVGCGVCLSIAADAARMAEKGMSISDIRKAIDAAYGSFGPATPTPMPPIF
ncbi:MAG: putative lipoprotein [Candidatus Carbobacillus altaicus]|uniref:Putative lipoprotein n=1 Tax=Candidatus Carbonibacillus altaicus TaxID=2163959 RepID=A0A2R6Y0Q9_9BACL|nr:MAG: putative lipoprotein [Candidatus Carbobacillus altaicus]